MRQMEPLSCAARPHPEGARVWMVTAGREKGEQEWVVAAVYPREETNEGTALRMREVDGRHEEFRVVVPHHANRSPHAQQVHTKTDRHTTSGSIHNVWTMYGCVRIHPPPFRCRCTRASGLLATVL